MYNATVRTVVDEVRPHHQVGIHGVPHHISLVRRAPEDDDATANGGPNGLRTNHEQLTISYVSDSSEEDDARSKTETETDSESGRERLSEKEELRPQRGLFLPASFKDFVCVRLQNPAMQKAPCAQAVCAYVP